MKFNVMLKGMNLFKLSLLLLFTSTANGQSIDPDTDLWQSLLTSYVKSNGGVDYIGFKKSEAKLDRFIQTYAAIKPKAMTENKKKALYINIYNAMMIKNILRYAASKKININSSEFLQLKINDIKIPGGNIWNGEYQINMAGYKVTLDQIEHGLIRGESSGELKLLSVVKLDPRIHAAVNCAALSCPRIREIAYTEENVDQLLDENIKAYVSSEEHFHKISDNKLFANSIVFWYYSDFDDFAQNSLKLKGAGSYLASFLKPETKDLAWKKKHLVTNFDDRNKISLRLSSAFEFDYNWKINDIRNKK
ncbi:MAG: DUF547 domain-containing protein [Bdellovibrionota bacterium]